jgi:hypothetical protein
MHRPARLCALCLLPLLLSGCAVTMGPHQRLGTAGSLTALGGGLTTFVGAELVGPGNPNAGATLIGVGSTASLVGTIVMLYALDAIMQAEARRDFPPLGPPPPPRRRPAQTAY